MGLAKQEKTLEVWRSIGKDFNLSPDVAEVLGDTIENGYTYYTGLVDNLGRWVKKTKKSGVGRNQRLVIDLDTGKLVIVPSKEKSKYKRRSKWRGNIDVLRCKRNNAFLMREGLF